MTEQEQIDKWRDEYMSILGPTGEYSGMEFLGFLMAKRAQKVIELPYVPLHSQWSMWLYLELEKAIEKAGYQYTIKGE